MPPWYDPKQKQSNTSRHNIFQLLKIKDKEKILKAVGEEEEHTIYTGWELSFQVYFSSETMQVNKQQNDNLGVLKEKTLTQNSAPIKLSLKSKIKK